VALAWSEPRPRHDPRELIEDYTLGADRMPVLGDIGTGLTRPLANGTYRKSQGVTISRLASLKSLFKQFYYFSDDNVIDVILGVVAGNHFDSDPTWLHLISAPSGGKTELLYSIFSCEQTYFLSDFTATSLISGYKDSPDSLESKIAQAEGEGQEDYSLLPKLNGKVVVTKDFSIIHDKPSEARAQILSILRDVYDGYASRALGNSKPKGFHSRFNYITGMTPDIEKSWSLNTLGERFLLYRISIYNRREHARRALLNTRDDDRGCTTVRKKIQAAVKSFIDQLAKTRPDVSNEMIEKILDLAEILSTCRTYVHRDRNDDMPCLPQAELAARVGKQLMRVGQSVALVRGRESVTQDEFTVMKRIALDSLPTNRRHLLHALWECKRNMLYSLEHFSGKVSRIAKGTVRRELENLAELGAVKRAKTRVPGNKNQTTKVLYRLTDEFVGYCEKVGGIPPS
jgi:hypothetical protein